VLELSTVAFGRARLAPLPPDIAKRLPANEEAERNILGGILIDNKSLKSVRDVLIASDFSVAQNQKIFLHMVLMADAGRPIDLTMLVEELSNNGQLEAAGGAGYLSGLGDGVPKVANIRFYAEIVKEKSRLRDLIYLTQNVQHKAMEGYSKPDELAAEFENFAKNSNTRENPAVVVGIRELLKLELPPPDWIMEPLFTKAGTGMIYSWAGLGKSWITTELAVALASGSGKFFRWPLNSACRTLYMYGEMHGGKIRERLVDIAKGHGLEVPEDEWLGVMSKDFQTIKRAPRCAREWRPNISEPRDRAIVEEVLFSKGYELLILDNISTLWSAAQEDQSRQVAVLKDWFIDLNQKGIAIIILQHAGKGGDFLGDSAQIHILDFVMKLRRPSNYKYSQQLRVNIEIEKIRYECKDPRWMIPFEVSLQTDRETGAVWMSRPSREAQREASFEMFRLGMKPGEIFQDVGISRSTAFRYKKQFDENSDSKHWMDQDDD
jgi:DnaB helicase-like protein/AAA domain-containing protein